LQRIDVNFQVVLKKAAEVLKNAAGQIGIIFCVRTTHKHLAQPATMPMRSRVCGHFLKKIEVLELRLAVSVESI
jgi:hypothetical protein